jgi:hypothetical protein
MAYEQCLCLVSLLAGWKWRVWLHEQNPRGQELQISFQSQHVTICKILTMCHTIFRPNVPGANGLGHPHQSSQRCHSQADTRYDDDKLISIGRIVIVWYYVVGRWNAGRAIEYPFYQLRSELPGSHVCCYALSTSFGIACRMLVGKQRKI